MHSYPSKWFQVPLLKSWRKIYLWLCFRNIFNTTWPPCQSRGSETWIRGSKSLLQLLESSLCLSDLEFNNLGRSSSTLMCTYFIFKDTMINLPPSDAMGQNILIIISFLWLIMPFPVAATLSPMGLCCCLDTPHSAFHCSCNPQEANSTVAFPYSCWCLLGLP